jgi:hypothetical protein
MKRSLTKAILLSALIFPGAGQFYLKRFKTALVLLTTIIICFAVMVASVMNIAMSAVQQIESQQYGVVNMTQLTQIATDATHQSSNTGFTLSVIIIVCCWVYSIVDVIIAARGKANSSSPA